MLSITQKDILWNGRLVVKQHGPIDVKVSSFVSKTHCQRDGRQVVQTSLLPKLPRWLVLRVASAQWQEEVAIPTSWRSKCALNRKQLVSLRLFTASADGLQAFCRSTVCDRICPTRGDVILQFCGEGQQKCPNMVNI